jgi:small redox-active disulfide protein 2
MDKIFHETLIIQEENMEIKILGPGCPKCNQTADLVKEALAESGVSATVEKVTDIMQIAKYGVFGTPAVIIGGDVKCMGKIPKKEEVLSWFKK